MAYLSEGTLTDFILQSMLLYKESPGVTYSYTLSPFFAFRRV